MSDYIEVNANTLEKTIVNLKKVHKINPVINGVGCIFHFDNGKTQSVSDSYEVIREKLIKSEVVEKKEPSKKENLTKS